MGLTFLGQSTDIKKDVSYNLSKSTIKLSSASQCEGIYVLHVHMNTVDNICVDVWISDRYTHADIDGSGGWCSHHPLIIITFVPYIPFKSLATAISGDMATDRKICNTYMNFCTLCMHNNNTKGPLTAVAMVSLTVLPNCPCFYRWCLWVWCHCMTSFREKVLCKIALVLIGQFLFTLVSHMTGCYFARLWLVNVGHMT